MAEVSRDQRNLEEEEEEDGSPLEANKGDLGHICFLSKRDKPNLHAIFLGKYVQKCF